MRARIRHAPLSRRHRLVFALALALIIALGALLAWTRYRLILWLFAGCGGSQEACARSMYVIDYWWVALIVGAIMVSGVAHWLTRDRLKPLDAPNG